MYINEFNISIFYCPVLFQKNKKNIYFAILTLSIIVLCFLTYKRILDKSNQSSQEIQSLGLQKITAIEVKPQDRQISYEFPSRISAYNISEIRPQVTGVIIKRMFNEGDFVKKGDILYVVDPAEKINIRAPISGYIGHSALTEGALIVSGQSTSIATITQLDPIYVDVTVSSEMYHVLKKKKNLNLSIDVNGEKHDHSGKINYSEVIVDQTTDSIFLRSKFPNKNKSLIPGMFAESTISFIEKNTITIPQRVVDFNDNGSMFVWIVDKNGEIFKQNIEVGDIIENDWIVTKGLKSGDIVVYEGFQKIQQGMQVEYELLS